MSGYIPHDDDVAMAYVHAANGDTWVAGRADALRSEFDRWLASVKAEVWEQGFFDTINGVDHALWKIKFDKNPYREERK